MSLFCGTPIYGMVASSELCEIISSELSSLLEFWIEKRKLWNHFEYCLLWMGSNERIGWCWRIHWNSQHLVHNEVREASFWKVLRECGHRPISFWPPSPSRSNWNTHLYRPLFKKGLSWVLIFPQQNSALYFVLFCWNKGKHMKLQLKKLFHLSRNAFLNGISATPELEVRTLLKSSL